MIHKNVITVKRADQDTVVVLDKKDDKKVDANQDNNKQTISRLDVFDNIELYMTEPFEKTDEGFLKGRAVVTNTGIFNYITKDGELLRELRPPEEVGNSDSLNSLKMIPIVDDHPGDAAVTEENAKELQVGFTGEDIRWDGHAVSIPLTITDGKCIEKIRRDGKVALSCGYRADLEMKGGYAYGNNQYDAIQRNIRYNHVAVVDIGRAGDLARMKLKMDSVDAININNKEYSSVTGNQNIVKEDTMDLKKIIIDNVEYQGEPALIDKYSTLQKSFADKDTILADKDKELTKLKADVDSLNDEKKKLQADIGDMKKKQMSVDQVNKRVKARLSIEKIADKLEVKVDESISDIDLKKAIIVKVYPTAKEKLDGELGKDEVYINGRFDHVVENLDSQISSENKKKIFDADKENNNQQDNSDSDEKRDYYADYSKTLQNAYLSNNSVEKLN